MRAEDRSAVGFERLRAEACALEHDLDTSSSEAWTDHDLTDLEETVRAEAALEDLVGRRTLIRNLVAEIRVEGAADVPGPSYGKDAPTGVRIQYKKCTSSSEREGRQSR